MPDITPAEWRILLDAVRCLEQDHREARNSAYERLKDADYPYREQALAAANFHAEYINHLSLLTAKVWRRAGARAAS